jgi:hypothetical protein
MYLLVQPTFPHPLGSSGVTFIDIQLMKQTAPLLLAKLVRFSHHLYTEIHLNYIQSSRSYLTETGLVHYNNLSVNALCGRC